MARRRLAPMVSSPGAVRGIAASAAAVAAFFAVAVLIRATKPLIDGDVWWHIRAGQEVLLTGAIPRTDTWSIVGAGEPWISQDWLANVILALGFGAGPWGPTLLSLLFGGLTMLSFWILWRAMVIRVPRIGWASRAGWLTLGLILAGPVLGVRVQVFDLLMAATVVWLCWRFVADPRRRWLAGLPIVAALWANLHAGWIMLFLLGGAVLVGESVDRMLQRQTHGPAPLAWHHIGELAVALAISVVALSINPNGLDLYGYPLMTASITGLRRYVLEWHPADIDTIYGQLLAGFTLVAILPTVLLGRRQLRAADLLIVVGLTIMAASAIRFFLFAGPIGAAVACVVLSPVLARTMVGRRISPVLERLARPQAGAMGAINVALIGAILVVGVGIAGLRASPPAQESAIEDVMPVAAVTWLDDHEPGDRIFNKHEWGGYLGLHRPHALVFMDGRADVYGDEALETYVSIIGVRGDPQAEFDRYDIDHAIFAPGTPLADWFDASPRWERAYADDVAVIWLRR